MTVIRWLNAIAQLPPTPLILHWVNPGEIWRTVGLWGWQKSADLPLLPPSPALHTSWRPTTSASKKTLTVSCCPCYCNCCSCKWMSVQVIPTFWDPGSRNWVENGGEQWFLGQRCPTMLRLLSQSFNLKTSALLCSVSPPSWLHFYYCVIINTFISLCFLWNGEAPSTKSKEIYSHTKSLFFFQHSRMKAKLEELFSSWTWIKSTFISRKKV